MWTHVRPAATLLAVLTAITGGAYPLVVTLAAKAAFPHQANGSLIVEEGQVVGSELIGRVYEGEGEFWGRPSATSPAYNFAASSGSNLGPTNPALAEAIKERVAKYGGGPVPADLVTASGSGLDPHVSPQGALFQVERVAKARGIEPETLRALVIESVEGRDLGAFGEPRVNVQGLNRKVEAIAKGEKK